MKNLMLSIFHQNIPYFKQLRPIAGSVTACILMQQLDYWFAKKPDGFDGWIEPSNHPNFTPDFCWTLQLGFSAEEFENAFIKIGTKYKSKTEYLNAEDKFKGKYYACYYDRALRKLFFFRNHRLLDKRLFQLAKNDLDNEGKPKSRKHKRRFLGNHESEITRSRKTCFTETSFSTLEKPELAGSFYIDKKITTKNITNNSLSSLNERAEENTIEREMINIWNKIVEEGRVPVKVTPARSKLLNKALTNHFQGNISNWKKYCELITSSKFLMGEVTSFRANIDWALKSEYIEKILEHSYKIGDRKHIAVEKVEMTQEQLAQLEESRAKEDLRRKIDAIQRAAQSQRYKDLKSTESNFSPEEILQLKEEFVAKFKKGEISGFEQQKDYFQEKGWGMPGVEIVFDMFKQDKLLPDLEEYLNQANEKLGYNIPDITIRIKEVTNAQ